MCRATRASWWLAGRAPAGSSENVARRARARRRRPRALGLASGEKRSERLAAAFWARSQRPNIFVRARLCQKRSPSHPKPLVVRRREWYAPSDILAGAGWRGYRLHWRARSISSFLCIAGRAARPLLACLPADDCGQPAAGPLKRGHSASSEAPANCSGWAKYSAWLRQVALRWTDSCASCSHWLCAEGHEPRRPFSSRHWSCQVEKQLAYNQFSRLDKNWN